MLASLCTIKRTPSPCATAPFFLCDFIVAIGFVFAVVVASAGGPATLKSTRTSFDQRVASYRSRCSTLGPPTPLLGPRSPP